MFIVQCVMTHCAMNTNNEHDVGLSEYAKFDNYKTITMTRMTCVHDEHDNYDKYDAMNMTCLNILGCEREVAGCAVKSSALDATQHLSPSVLLVSPHLYSIVSLYHCLLVYSFSIFFIPFFIILGPDATQHLSPSVLLVPPHLYSNICRIIVPMSPCKFLFLFYILYPILYNLGPQCHAALVS